jgi:DNA-binding MarR family transcriptional regulator
MTKKQPKLKFESLKGRDQQILTRLTNSIAFQNQDCCSVEDIAEQFKTTPGRIKANLTRLEEAGLIQVQGEEFQQVVPTAKLLRHQDKKLSEAQAEKLVRQYKRGKYE